MWSFLFPTHRLPPLFLILLLIALAPAAQANWMGNIQEEFASPSYLPHGKFIHVTFDYDISEEAGVRFKITPLSNGQPTPNYSWTGSSIYPTGGGEHSTWFAVQSGDVWVDQYRLEMRSADWSQTLLSITLPVHYHFGDHAVYLLQPDATSPSILSNGNQLQVSFATGTENPDGAYVSVRPYLDGHLAGGYAASGVSVVPAGDGSGTQHFTYPTGEYAVDALHVLMTSPDQQTTLLEFSVPADYHWSSHGLANILLTPSPPAYLPWNEHVVADFDYSTALEDIAAIYAGGYTVEGYAPPHEAWEGSGPMPPPSGHGSRFWTIIEGDQPVHIDFTSVSMGIYPPDSSPAWVLLRIPSEYHFGPHAVHDISISPVPPAILDNDQSVSVGFTYDTINPGGVRIWAVPYSHGQFAGGWTSGSPIVPTGTGTLTRSFGVDSGDVLVDQIMFRMTDGGSGATLLEFFLDTTILFGGSGIVVGAPDPLVAVPKLLPNTPNPCNPSTRIAFTLPRSGTVHLTVYDLLGRRVRRLLDGIAPAGRNEVTWNGRDDTGRAAPSGIYLYRLETEGKDLARHMTLVR